MRRGRRTASDECSHGRTVGSRRCQSRPVRFPPCPTGLLHVGSARTALYNWLYARHAGGKLVLRFEDTDRARSTDEAVDQALRVLEWLGIDWDEGPHRQTRALASATPHGRCDWSRRARRTAATARPRSWRPSAAAPGGRPAADLLGALPPPQRRASGRRSRPRRPSAVRLAMRRGGRDGDRGRGPRHGALGERAPVGDHVIVRSDGDADVPVRQPAGRHRDRGSATSSAARTCSPRRRASCVYRALGAPEPLFAHLPMILGPDKKRLSKRHGAVSVEEFRERGYLAETMRNYLALIGWSFDDKTTVMTTRGADRAVHARARQQQPGVFDFAKLEWLNGEHLRRLTPERFARSCCSYLERSGSPLAAQPERVRRWRRSCRRSCGSCRVRRVRRRSCSAR